MLFPLLVAGRGALAAAPISVMEKEHEDHGRNLERLGPRTGPRSRLRGGGYGAPVRARPVPAAGTGRILSPRASTGRPAESISGAVKTTRARPAPHRCPVRRHASRARGTTRRSVI